MSTTDTGRRAEELAAHYLIRRGHRVLARNWRTRSCEIDLITRDRAGVHLIEVKYRVRTDQGRASEYVTADKMRRLARAAGLWAQAEGYDGPLQIDVISIEGDLEHPRIVWLENVIAAGY